MVWETICGTQGTHLKEFGKVAKQTRGKIVESITSTDYINQILEPSLEPWYRAVEEDRRRPIYMQDSASIHSSAEVCL